MSLVCRDGISECLGCRLCLEHHDNCDVCHRPMNTGDKYYRIYNLTVCEKCITVPSSELCLLCKAPARDGIKYEDIVLCRSCSSVATGFIGYI